MLIQSGDWLGLYRVVTCLKTGGMGALYLCRRDGPSGFSRPVAVKVVRPQLADDPATVEMLISEARLASRIDHPNVVHVEELGRIGNAYFLVMPFVHGVSLSELGRALKRCNQRLPIEYVVSLVIQIADGLHAAHEARAPGGERLNLVHRDVSPENVLLSFTGHVKLIDFGIARAPGESGDVQTNSLQGKLRYMAPEQARCQPIDRRADIYALGVILWELLTMRPLLEGTNDVVILEQARAPKIVPPSHLREGVPAALDAVLMNALAVDPEARLSTAQEFRRLLAEAVPTALTLAASDLAARLQDLFPDREQEEKRGWDLASSPRPHQSATNAVDLRRARRIETPGIAPVITLWSSDASTAVGNREGTPRADQTSRFVAPSLQSSPRSPITARVALLGMVMVVGATAVSVALLNARTPPASPTAEALGDHTAATEAHQVHGPEMVSTSHAAGAARRGHSAPQDATAQPASAQTGIAHAKRIARKGPRDRGKAAPDRPVRVKPAATGRGQIVNIDDSPIIRSLDD